MKLGARILKTGLAVMITMFICKTFGLEPAFFGAVSAVINMQPTIYLTLKTAKDQILVHIIGVAAALVFGHLFGVNLFTMGLITILIIWLYLQLGLQSGITMGIVAALFVMGSGPEDFLPHALMRTGVIFAGLITAMLVNIFLWPPRYRHQFEDKLRQANEAAVAYFCQSVSDYVRLDNQEVLADAAAREKLRSLNRECRTLAEFLGRDGQLFSPVSAGGENWSSAAEKLLEYNQSITGKADRIYDLLPIRLERRLSSGARPISDEFRTILDLLAGGCNTISRVNEKLRTLILDGRPVEAEEIRENYWERLNIAIDQWQPSLSGSHYLHTLLEIAVIANEIKWAARQAKTLLTETQAGLPADAGELKK